jgi:hypothetical protein
MVYVRFRHGYLSVRVSEVPTDDVYDAVKGKEIFGGEISDGLDGCMEEAEMLVIAGLDVID